MKVKFYHWYNAILASLLSMLGFSGCDGFGKDMYGSPIMEYGTPYADYQVKGVVTDEAGQPIPGIRVELAERVEYVGEKGEQQIDDHGLDTLQTDARGEYKSRLLEDYANSSHYLKVIVEDVDGPANGGEFQGDTLSVSDLERKKIKEGDGGWYTGRYEYTGDVTLRKKLE